MTIWEGFKRKEFACKCCGVSVVDADLLEALKHLKAYFRGATVSVMSGYRCAIHNKRVGGAKNSQHMLGIAADLKVTGVAPKEVADYLEAAYPGKHGIGRYATFTHFDIRDDRARWGSN